MKDQRRRAYLALFAYALIVGFSFLFSKLAMAHTESVLDFLLNRFFIALVFILAYILVRGEKLNYKSKGIKKLLPLALASPMAFTAMQAYGLKYTSSSEAGIILALIPIFTLVLASYFLGEKTNFYQKLSVGLSFVGVVYIMVNKGSLHVENIKGPSFLIISALAFSIYSVMARSLAKDYSNTELSLVMMGVSFIFFLGLYLLRGLVGQGFASSLAAYKNREFLMAILYLGVLSTLCTSALTNFALARLEASKMVVFSNLGTVISIIAGYVFLNEKIYYYHIIGSAMIILGIIGTNYFSELNK